MAAVEVMDGEAVRRWFRLATDALAQTRSAIDAISVFPVPDSDTGTNLHLTRLSAADAVDDLPQDASPAQVWRAAADGAMLGACGNSGIIVSQLLRGLSDVCVPAAPCDGTVLARALGHAAGLARAAVSRPVEGTVLTVAEAAALAAARYAQLSAVAAAAAAGARLALARTGQQLDVLADSGVVDAGAAGLCVLLDALTAAITGTLPPCYEVPAPAAAPARLRGARRGPQRASYGYEVTYLLAARAPEVSQLRERLDALGDSLVIVGGDDHVHVHVHVHVPDAGAAIEAGLQAGRPRRITVTYLGPGAPQARLHRAVAIADADGLAVLLGEAGAAIVGYQGRLLPTSAALAGAFRQAGRQVIAVPGTAEVAALAREAAALLADEGVEVSVLGLRSPVQALAAMAVHDPCRELSADAAAMGRAADAMRCGSVRPAGSSVTASGAPASAAGNGAVSASTVGQLADRAVAQGSDQAEVAVAVADVLISGGAELVTLVAGDGADPGLAQRVAAHLRQASPGIEIDCYNCGGQGAFLLIGAE
jgi:DAK2 domain fusion protein YloV